jgi:hypothetical protein
MAEAGGSTANDTLTAVPGVAVGGWTDKPGLR